jgi:N-acetylneuraminic acid mutarotase
LPNLADAKTELGGTSGPFPLTISSNLTGLDANTSYFVRAYATNSAGTAYGRTVEFKTLDSAIPILNIAPTEFLSPYGFVANAIFAAAGGSPTVSKTYGFIWSAVNATPTLGGANVSKQERTDALPRNGYQIDATISELQPNQTYYLRAFCSYTTTTGSGIVYTDVLPVKTATIPNVPGMWREVGTYNQANYASFVSVGDRQFWVSSTNTNEVAPLTGALTRKANFPGTASGTTMLIAVGQKLYLLHGRDRSLNYVRETWEYDIATDKWTRKADFPGTLRMTPCLGSVGGKVYYGLGSQTTSSSAYLTDWWEYDPATDKWTQKKDHPDQTNGNAAYAVGGKLYLIANFDKSTSYASRRVYEYEPATDGWRRMKDAPAGELITEGKTTTLLNGKIYAIQQARTYTHCWEFDPTTDTWAERRALGARLLLPDMFALSNKLYLIAGTFTTSSGSKLFEFTP